MCDPGTPSAPGSLRGDDGANTLTPEAWQEAEWNIRPVNGGSIRNEPVGADRPGSGAPYASAWPTGVSQPKYIDDITSIDYNS